MISKVLGTALLAALMVAGLSSAQAQETLKIGGVGPLSGGGTAWGLAAPRGMEIANEEINAAGGVKAEGKTYKLQLVKCDDQHTGAGGKAAAERRSIRTRSSSLSAPWDPRLPSASSV